MKRSLLIGAACAVFAFSGVPTQAASCGEDECSPSPPPSLPNTPDQTTHRTAFFSAYPGYTLNGGGSPRADGSDGIYVIGQGPASAFGDDVYTFGDMASSVTLQANVAGAAVTSTAHQTGVGRSNVGTALTYGLTLTASDSTVADAIAAILVHNPLAAISGSYNLSASGNAISNATGSSSFGPNSNADAYGFYAQCGQGINNSTCGTSSWTMLLGFQRGTAFANGDANSFYAQFRFEADALAGCSCGSTAYPGDATSFVDPNVLLNSQLQQFGNNISLSPLGGLGNGGFTALAGNVPEPASWALMLGGFGMLGGAVRRRRTLATA